MTDYDLEVDRVVKEVRKVKAKRVGLQFPEGLKDKALEVASKIEAKTKATVIVMADPTYGACDVKTQQAKKLGIDLLVHFGHTEF
jgi:2-(3-amino-3-carboxypropyl)histidine synthase